LVHKIGGHSDAVTAVAFNPYHPQLATTGLDSTVRFYSDRGERDG
jgi:WD40 repeat protein